MEWEMQADQIICMLTKGVKLRRLVEFAKWVNRIAPSRPRLGAILGSAPIASGQLSEGR